MHSRAKIRRCSFFTHNKVQGQINKAAGEKIKFSVSSCKGGARISNKGRQDTLKPKCLKKIL